VRALRLLAEFELAEHLRGCEDGGVDDARYGEGAANDGTHLPASQQTRVTLMSRAAIQSIVSVTWMNNANNFGTG